MSSLKLVEGHIWPGMVFYMIRHVPGQLFVQPPGGGRPCTNPSVGVLGGQKDLTMTFCLLGSSYYCAKKRNYNIETDRKTLPQLPKPALSSCIKSPCMDPSCRPCALQIGTAANVLLRCNGEGSKARRPSRQ